MSDFLSKFTGQEIEAILDSVDGKVAKTDIATTLTDDATLPAAVSLVFKLNKTVEDINTSLGENYLRIDGGVQTVNGAKTFASVIAASGGITVPTGRAITITDEPTQSGHAVNLNFLRKHGVSEDTASNTSGLEITILGTGYNSLKMNVARLTTYTDTATLPLAVPVQTATGTNRWTIAAMFTAIYADTRLTNGYVSKNTFDSTVTDLEADIGDRVTTQAFSQNNLTVSNELAKKQDLLKTSSISVPASGTAALADFDKVNCLSMLVTATWGALTDVYRFTVGNDGTVKTEILIQKSTAGVLTATGSIVSNKIRVTFANANTTTAAVVDYKITASF